MLRVVSLALASCTVVVAESAPLSYAETVRADRPASYWRFADGRDETGRADATVTGNVSFREGAAVFDGATSGLIAPDVYAFGGTSPFTIEVWIAPSPGGPPIQRVCNHRIGPPHTGWRLYLDASKRAVFERWNDEVILGTVSAPLVAGVEAHVVVRYDGTELSMWIDGLPRDRVNDARPIGSFRAALAWGTASTANIDFFMGRLDEGAIWERALSPERIRAHHAAR